MNNQEIIAQIKAQITLSSVISEKIKLTMRGGRLVGLCPFHQEKTPSFYVDDNEHNYYCFGCHAKGDVFQFLMDNSQMSFPEALEYLAARANIKLAKQFKKEIEKSKNALTKYTLLEDAKNWFCKQLYSDKAIGAIHYLKHRNITSEIIAKYEIGFASNEKLDLYEFLKSKKYSETLIQESGLISVGEDGSLYKRFKNRIIFPIFDVNKNVVGFGGRALLKEQQPKYLNSPETEIFKKSQLLYNLNNAKKRGSNEIIIVEGYLDAISLNEIGNFRAVATMGTAVSQAQIMSAWQYSDEPIFCFDGDAAGFKAMQKVIDICLPIIKDNKNLKFIILPENIDPDDAISKNGSHYFQKLVDAALGLSDFMWYTATRSLNFATAEDKAKLERYLKAQVAKIKDSVLLKHYKDFFNNAIWKLSKNNRANSKTKQKGQNNIINFDHNKVSALEKYLLSLIALIIKFPILLRNTEVINEFTNLNFRNDQINNIQTIILELVDLEKIGDDNYHVKIEESLFEILNREFSEEVNYLCGNASIFIDHLSKDSLQILAMKWLLTLNYFQASCLEEEYDKNVREMTEESFERAITYKKEIEKLKMKINNLEFEIDDLDSSL